MQFGSRCDSCPPSGDLLFRTIHWKHNAVLSLLSVSKRSGSRSFRMFVATALRNHLRRKLTELLYIYSLLLFLAPLSLSLSLIVSYKSFVPFLSISLLSRWQSIIFISIHLAFTIEGKYRRTLFFFSNLYTLVRNWNGKRCIEFLR